MSTKFIAYTAAAAVVGTFAFAGEASARDQIHVAGSSTVLPYANIVAEQFGKTYSNFKTPIVESGGTGAGIKQFCQGLGDATIDIAELFAQDQEGRDRRVRQERREGDRRGPVRL